MLIFCQSGEISPNLVTLILHKVTAKKVYNIGPRLSERHQEEKCLCPCWKWQRWFIVGPKKTHNSNSNNNNTDVGRKLSLSQACWKAGVIKLLMGKKEDILWLITFCVKLTLDGVKNWPQKLKQNGEGLFTVEDFVGRHVMSSKVGRGALHKLRL